MQELSDAKPIYLPAGRSGTQTTAHWFQRDDVLALETALDARRPLLLRGEPGVGKSQLARAAAHALKRCFHASVLDARTGPRDLLYEVDHVRRLAEAQLLQVQQVTEPDELRKRLAPHRFTLPGPLWWAFDYNRARRAARRHGCRQPELPPHWKPADGSVLLLDEIDKADPSVPNALLQALGEREFVLPGGRQIQLEENAWPLIIITTNEERVLPNAFLRRCLVHHLGLPDDRRQLVELLVQRGRAHFPNLAPETENGGFDEGLLREVAELVADDRATERMPGAAKTGQAEFLDLLRVLDAQRLKHDDLRVRLEQIKRFALSKQAPVSNP